MIKYNILKKQINMKKIGILTIVPTLYYVFSY
jgi:hypothetical protein